MGEETNLYDPIIIFPEGGTTNGRYLINFKRGAFLGLRAVFPKVHIQHSMFQQPSSGILEGLPFYLIGSAIPFSYLQIIHMPIFRPNEYFYKHHKKEGEEDYQAFMRVVRELMAEVGGFELVDESIEDKFEYKKLIFPKKQATQSSQSAPLNTTTSS